MQIALTEIAATELPPDLMRVAHLLSVSLAAGLVGFLNFSLLKRWFLPMNVGWVVFHLRAQEFVIGAAIFAWISGNLLLWLLYDLDSSRFAGALWVKLVMVKALFVSALYTRLNLPKVLRQNAGLRISELSISPRLRVGFAAGLSLTCWLGTFLISASQTIQNSPSDLAMEVVLCVAAICLGSSLLLALTLRRTAPIHALRSAERKSGREFGPVNQTAFNR